MCFGHKGGKLSVIMRDAILCTARDLFYERGIDRTSMRDIAGRIGLAQSSLYNHFKTKDDLVLAVMENSFETVSAPVLKTFLGKEPTLALLREALHIHAFQHSTELREGAIFGFRDRHVPEKVRRRMIIDRDRYESCFQGLVEALARCGCIDGRELNVKVKLLLGAGVTVGNWFRPGGRLDAHEVADLFADLGMEALHARTPCARHLTAG